MSHRDLRFWDVAHLLMEKYDFTQEDADGLSNFLLPMLAFDPKERATARACAGHREHLIAFSAPFYTENDHFTKTGSGQT